MRSEVVITRREYTTTFVRPVRRRQQKADGESFGSSGSVAPSMPIGRADACSEADSFFFFFF